MPLVEVPGRGEVEFPDTMSPEDMDKAIRDTWPDLAKPESARDTLLAEQKALLAEPEPSTLREFLTTVSEPFIPLHKPDAPADAGFIQKAATGLARSAISVAEGLESPATVALGAISAIPVVGKPLAISTGAGIGTHIALESGPAFYEAVKRGDVQGAAEAVGNFFAGTLFAGGGIKAAMPAKAPPVAVKLAPVTAAEYNKTVGATETFAEKSPSLPTEAVATPASPNLAPLTEAAAKVEAPAVGPKPIQEGPGAMTPSELDPVRPMITSDKLRLMDQRREELGLPKQDPALKFTNEQALEQAKAEIDADPGWLDALVGELRDKPRAVYPFEEAALNIRRAELNIELERSLKNWKEAFEGNDYGRAADEGAKVDRWREAVDDMDSITGRGGTGTEAGRSLQARKMALTEEFRLARMDMETRQAKGEDLTPQETKRVVELNEKINKTQKEFDERVAQLEAENAKLQAQLEAERLGKQADADAKAGPERDIAGEGEEITGAIKKRAPRKPKEGELPDIEEDLAAYIKALAKNAAEQGVRGLDPITDAVHKIVEPLVPGITKRQIQDAFSDYGISKPATTEPVKVHLQQIRQEAQKTSALQDIIEKQQAPLATGQQRVPQSDATRRLIKEINEAKKKYNIQTTDPARQLKSTLDAIKTRLTNAIKDAEFEIATRQKIVRTKNAVPSDAETVSMRARLDDLRAQLAEIFPKEPMSDAQRLKVATAAAERSEVNWAKRLEEAKKGNFETGQPRPNKVTSPELEAIQARRDAAKESVKELYDLANPKKTPEQIALQTLKTRLANRTAELLNKAARGDFEPKPKRQPLDISKDPEAMRLKAENELAKQEYKAGLEKYVFQRKNVFQKTAHYAGNVYDLARVLMTTGEFSFVLRQGKFAMASRPITSSRAIPNALRAMRSEQKAMEVDMQVFEHPDFKASQRAKLFTMKEGEGSLNKMEEMLMGRWSNVIPVVSSFNRAARVFLNKLRFDNWLAMRKSMSKAGMPTPENDALIALYINEGTGRGGLGKYGEPAAVLLNRLLFSPRYLASRFQYMTGHSLFAGKMEGSAPARKAIATEYGRTLIGLALYYGMLKWYFSSDKDNQPSTVEVNPISSDAGKVRVGDTRIDPLAGVAQLATFGARTITLHTKNNKGVIKPLHGKVDYGADRWSDVANRFGWSKSHPTIGKVRNLLDGVDLVGNVVTPEGELLTIAPMTWIDIYVALKEQELSDGVAMGILGFLGEGIQTHVKK